MSAEVPADWTTGHPAVAFQRCRACGQVWYFRRSHCPHCGVEGPEDRIASGRGVVATKTVVHRAPTEAMKARVPYAILLVDAEEGFRLMTHGTLGLAIGDRVAVGFHDLDGRLLPWAEAAP